MRLTANLETQMSRMTNSLGPVFLLLLSAGAAAPIEPRDLPALPPEPFAAVKDHKKTYYAQFTPDSKSLALKDSNDAVRLYDLETRQLGPVVVEGLGHGQFTLSPCGRFLLKATDWLGPKFQAPAGFRIGECNLVLWDIKTGQPLDSTLSTCKPEPEPYPLFAPDGSRFYYVNPDNAVGVWDTAKRAGAGTFKGPPTPISAFALSADGKQLAVASLAAGPSGRLDVWDTAKAERVHTFELKWSKYRLAFLPDGKTLLAAGPVQVNRNRQGMVLAEHGIRRFDMVGGKELDPLPLSGRLQRIGVTTFRLSPDGRTGFLIGASGGFYLIDPQTGKEVGPGWIRLWFPDLLISADGKYVAGTGSDGACVYTTESLLKAK